MNRFEVGDMVRVEAFEARVALVCDHTIALDDGDYGNRTLVKFDRATVITRPVKVGDELDTVADLHRLPVGATVRVLHLPA